MERPARHVRVRGGRHSSQARQPTGPRQAYKEQLRLVVPVVGGQEGSQPALVAHGTQSGVAAQANQK